MDAVSKIIGGAVNIGKAALKGLSSSVDDTAGALTASANKQMLKSFGFADEAIEGITQNSDDLIKGLTGENSVEFMQKIGVDAAHKDLLLNTLNRGKKNGLNHFSVGAFNDSLANKNIGAKGIDKFLSSDPMNLEKAAIGSFDNMNWIGPNSVASSAMTWGGIGAAYGAITDPEDDRLSSAWHGFTGGAVKGALGHMAWKPISGMMQEYARVTPNKTTATFFDDMTNII